MQAFNAHESKAHCAIWNSGFLFDIHTLRSWRICKFFSFCRVSNANTAYVFLKSGFFPSRPIQCNGTKYMSVNHVGKTTKNDLKITRFSLNHPFNRTFNRIPCDVLHWLMKIKQKLCYFFFF